MCTYTDLELVLQYLEEKFGSNKTNIIAFSYGSIMTRLLLSKPVPIVKPGWYPQTALLNSCPFDITTNNFITFEKIGYLGLIYNYLLTKRMKKTYITLNLATPDSLECVKILRHLDDKFLAPAWGYEGYKDFYRAASTFKKDVENIKIPVIILNSRDDPLVHPKATPGEWFAGSKFVMLARAFSGGHCAFIPFGWNWKRYSTYFEDIVDQYLEKSYIDELVEKAEIFN